MTGNRIRTIYLKHFLDQKYKCISPRNAGRIIRSIMMDITRHPNRKRINSKRQKCPKVAKVFGSLIMEQTFSTGLDSVMRKRYGTS